MEWGQWTKLNELVLHEPRLVSKPPATMCDLAFSSVSSLL
jgi:hypothetical protein